MSKPTPIADMITEMLKNCIPLEMILVAVRSMEMALSTRHEVDGRVDVAAEKRRAWDREYRRRKRGCPPDPPDIHPNPPDVGSASISSIQEDSSIIVDRKKKRGCKLPPDWKPKQSHYDEGAKLGMGPRDVDERAESMRNWCAANANRSVTTKADWDAAFLGAWLRGNSKHERNGSVYPHPSAQQSGSTSVLAGVAAAAERRARERNAAGQHGQVHGDGHPAERDDPELL